MAAYKLKHNTVPSPKVIKFDFTIGFSVVDSPENKVFISSDDNHGSLNLEH